MQFYRSVYSILELPIISEQAILLLLGAHIMKSSVQLI